VERLVVAAAADAIIDVGLAVVDDAIGARRCGDRDEERQQQKALHERTR
jgi:hypothetical protein